MDSSFGIIYRYRILLVILGTTNALAFMAYFSFFSQIQVVDRLQHHMKAMVESHRLVLIAQTEEKELLRLAYQHLGLAFRSQSSGDDPTGHILRFNELFEQYEQSRNRAERVSKTLERQVTHFAQLLEGEET